MLFELKEAALTTWRYCCASRIALHMHIDIQCSLSIYVSVWINHLCSDYEAALCLDLALVLHVENPMIYQACYYCFS